MIEAYQREMEECINKLISQEALSGKRVVVFGSNDPAECIADYLKEKGYKVVAFIDNNKKKQGTKVGGIPVFAPEQYLLPYQEDVVVYIASKYYNEMCGQLEYMGYQRESQVFQIVNMNRSSAISISKETFEAKERELKLGLQYLSKIEGYVFICPYAALGDIYLVGGYIKKYCKKNHISEWCIVVPSEVCRKVFRLFEVQNVIVLGQEIVDILVQTVVFLGERECQAKILHQRFPYTVKLGNIGNYHGFDFNSLFAEGIFHMSVTDFEEPKRGMFKAKIEELFIKKNWKRGKTVLFAPYANTVTALEKEFWNGLVKQYKNEGYVVLTNSSGEHEPPLEGTEAVFVPIEEIIDFVECAGFFVGLRSGLCDLVGSANAKKIIYYPNRIYQCGQIIDFYGLKNMGVSGDIEEILV